MAKASQRRRVVEHSVLGGLGCACGAEVGRHGVSRACGRSARGLIVCADGAAVADEFAVPACGTHLNAARRSVAAVFVRADVAMCATKHVVLMRAEDEVTRKTLDGIWNGRITE